MNEENKHITIIRQVSNIAVFVLPILTILYFLWRYNTQLFIFLKYYKFILFGCNLILWIGFIFTFIALITRKRVLVGTIFFFIMISCLSIGTLGLMGASNTAYLFNGLPELYSQAQLGKNLYYLTSEGGGQGKWFLELYECGNPSFHCELVFRDWDRLGGHLIVDASSKEINIIDDANLLIYTYGEHPRYYKSWSEIQLEDGFYYLSYHCKSSDNPYGWNIYDCSNTFTLYQCNLNYTGCDPLPIEYTTNTDDFLDLEADETTNEINLYKDDGNSKTLIFTYGANPECYIAGCTITDK